MGTVVTAITGSPATTTAIDRPASRGHSTLAKAAIGSLLVVLVLLAQIAIAAPAFGSSKDLHSVSCPSTSTCYVVGNDGTILATTNGGSTWNSQVSGTSNPLSGVSCPSASTCYAVGGYAGTILKTTDGGSTWNSQPSGTSEWLGAVSCPSASTCYAVGTGGVILRTTNGGSSWSSQYSAASSLSGVSCPTASTCYAVGYSGAFPNFNGAILATTNGGTSWSSQPAGTPNPLEAVSCPTVSACWAVGWSGTIRATTNGGANWSGQSSGTPQYLYGVSCPSASTCYAVGQSGTILATTNGGTSWSSQSSGTSNQLFAVSCPTVSDCWAVGWTGTIQATTNGGATWSRQGPAQCSDELDNDGDGKTDFPADLGCSGPSDDDETDPPPAQCSDGTDNDGDGKTDFPADLGCSGPSDNDEAGFGNPSSQCSSPDAKVADGYAGSATYVRLRVQEDTAANETWVCVRASNGGSLEFGGRFVVKGLAANTGGVSLDSSSGVCSTTPGNQVPAPHPALKGALGDPSSPPYVPFMLDSYSAAGEAWVCVEAGSFKQRAVVRLPSAQAPAVTFEPDDPPSAPPPPTPGRVGYASSTCQDGVGGSKQQLVNADLADGHVWAYTWQPSSQRVHVCARAEMPPAAGGQNAGGMLTIDAGSPGVQVTQEVSDDLTPCTVNVAQLDNPVQAQLSRSPGTNPVSLCVRAGSTQKRVTLGASGSPVPPSVTWTPDPGTPG